MGRLQVSHSHLRDEGPARGGRHASQDGQHQARQALDAAAAERSLARVPRVSSPVESSTRPRDADLPSADVNSIEVQRKFFKARLRVLPTVAAVVDPSVPDQAGLQRHYAVRARGADEGPGVDGHR